MHTPASSEAWRRDRPTPSLPEAHRTVAIGSPSASAFRRFLAFAGPGCMVAVGYMDPGNWATDLAGGSQYGYTLLSVVLLSSLMAMLLQHLCVKLGIATGRDLAQSCRDHYPQPVVWFLFVTAELAIAACDLAEVVGSAIGLQLLFGIPLLWGCAITACDVLVILLLQRNGFRWLEAFVIVLIVTIGACFAVEIALAKPSLTGMLLGLAPSPAILHDRGMLYMAIGILGATVMPHNLYLHSSLVQTRAYPRTPEGRREAIRFATIDSNIALTFAFFISASILVLAAAAFHEGGHFNVAELQQAYKLLDGALGVGFASILFGVALLASGQNSTLTGTLAGQIVMQGFINLRMPAWASRLMTRSVAIIPAVIVIGVYGEKETTNLLVFSQVCLSMQLGFAVWPLMRFTSDRTKMGEFVNPLWLKVVGWTITLAIIALNLKLLTGWVQSL